MGGDARGSAESARLGSVISVLSSIYTNALRPVMERPTINVFISRVPS